MALLRLVLACCVVAAASAQAAVAVVPSIPTTPAAAAATVPMPTVTSVCDPAAPQIDSPITFNKGNGDGWGLDFRPHTFSQVSINGGGNTATVAAGATVKLSYEYSMTMLPNAECATCIYFQEYVGLMGTNQTLYCNNYVDQQPNGNVNVSVSFQAPAIPGLYWIIGVYEFQAECKAFWKDFEPDTEGRGMPFAAIQVECPPLPAIQSPLTLNQGNGDGWGLDARPHTFSQVSVNGGGNTASVMPGANVTLSYQYSSSLAAAAECATCDVQEYVGLSGTNQTITCSTFMGSVLPSGAVAVTFTAPLTPGLYWIVGVYEFQYSCKAFWQNYSLAVEGRAMPFAAISVLNI